MREPAISRPAARYTAGPAGGPAAIRTAVRSMVLLSAMVTALLAAPSIALAAEEEGGGDPDAVGHSADGYYLNVEPFGTIELPRLLLIRDAEGHVRFDAFGSTHAALHSGRYTLLTAEGEAMSEADVEHAVEAHAHLYFPLVPEGGGQVLVDFSITRQLLFVFICAFIVVLVTLRLAARYRRGLGRDEAPRGAWQNMMEVLIVFIRDEVARPALGPKYKTYLPFLLTTFFFILLANLMGLVPYAATATSHIMVTGTLALFTFVITQFSGTKDYWKHIFWPPGVPVPIKFILIPVEFIGIFTKPLALAFRLFGNMVSGHLVIVSILGLIFIFTAQIGSGAGIGAVFISIPLTLFIYMLKIVVSFIQAYIFVMLSAVFIGMAAAEHEHYHEEAGHEPILVEGRTAAGVGGGPGMSGNGRAATQPSLTEAH